MSPVARPFNPYYDYAAVRTPEMFFGREDTLREIYAASQRRQCVSLVGMRHIGKSSILGCVGMPEIQARYGYDVQNCLFILIDLRDYLEKTRADFFQAVCEPILSQSQRVPNLTLPSREGEDQFRKLLQDIQRAGFYPVLLMDSFDNVTRNEQFDKNFFSFLRSLATRGFVSYVTASIKPLHDVCHDEITDSPFFNIFPTCRLDALTPEEARQLVTVPLNKAQCPCSHDEVEWIIKLAGRHPFFLQRTCHFFFEEKSQQEHTNFEPKRVEARVYEELLPHFERAWNELLPEQQQELQHALRQSGQLSDKLPELSESALFRKYVHELAGAGQFEISAKDLKDALDNINDNEFLARCKLAQLQYITLRDTASANSKGLLVRELLKAAFERLRAGGVRSDSAAEWRPYNILYYHYFKYHLQNENTAARLGIGSKRQFYREQDKAIQLLLKEVLGLEAASSEEE